MGRLLPSAVLALGLACISAVVARQTAAPAPSGVNAASARLDQTLGGLDGPGFGVTYSEELGLLVAACENGSLHYWGKDVAMGVRGGDRTPRALRAHKGPVTAVVSAAGTFASAGVDGKVIVWELPAEKMAHTLTSPAAVRALALTPDGKTVASAGDDAAVQLWDVATGKAGPKLEGSKDWLLSLAFSAEGKTVAAGGYDGKLRLWQVSSGKKLVEVEGQPPAPPNTPARPANVLASHAFSPDGKTVAVGGSDAQIHLFQTTDGKLVRSLPGHTSTVTGLAFHPSGSLLASSSKDRTVRLWNPANGQMLKSLEGHTAWVQGVTFFAQGTRLASVGADRTVRLWDLAQPPKQ
jgi:WD40 repeat protein